MDNELIHYIVTYFSHLMTEKDQLGMKHLRSTFKMEHSDNGRSGEKMEHWIDFYKRIGWITEDEEILELIKGGQEDFDKNVAERILKDHRDKIHFNNCPSCGRLARTPFARQCRYCGHNWR